MLDHNYVYFSCDWTEEERGEIALAFDELENLANLKFQAKTPSDIDWITLIRQCGANCSGSHSFRKTNLLDWSIKETLMEVPPNGPVHNGVFLKESLPQAARQWLVFEVLVMAHIKSSLLARNVGRKL